MKRLEYQEETVERFTDYLETLVTKRDAAEKLAELAREHGMEPPNVDWCGQAWDALKTSGVLPKARDASGALYVPPWLHRADGIGRPVPNICLKLPTGAGKTYLATRGVEQLQRIYYRRAHGLVLWIVPSDAIYTQTWKTLANREHPYRMTLERASGGRVKLLRRGDAFTKTDVENYLCVFVMMMAAAARQEAQRIVALHEAREAIARERAEVRAVMPRVESRGVLVPRLPLSTLNERLFEVEAAEAAHVEATAIAAEQARQVAARARAVEATRQASRQASRQAQLKAGEAQEAERARAVQLAQEATVKATDAALLGLLAYKATEAKAEAERAARDTQVEAAKDRAEARAAHQHAHLKAAHDLESRFVPRRSVERKVRGEVSGVESEVSEEAIRVTAEEGERMGRMVVAQQMLAEYRAGACFADRRLLHDFD
jgi:hypothetical protein